VWPVDERSDFRLCINFCRLIADRLEHCFISRVPATTLTLEAFKKS